MSNRRMIFLTMLTVMAGILSFVESTIPIPIPVPGFKLGLANIISIYIVVNFGIREALTVVILRVLLGSFLSGTLLSSGFFMSLMGGLFACLIMYIIHRYTTIFSVLGVSVCGAVAHNVGQLFVAAFIIDSVAIWYYLPYLLVFAVFTGSFNGLLVLHLPNSLNTYLLEKY